MAYFEKEELRQAKQMSAIEFLKRYRAKELVRCGTGEYELRSHDSFKISESTSLWHWKSRDIGPQGIVFVIKPECTHFYNYSEYAEFVLSYSISLPVYLLDKGRKEHRIDSNCKITIGSNEPIFINVIREGYYTFDVGIDLTNNEEDNFL